MPNITLLTHTFTQIFNMSFIKGKIKNILNYKHPAFWVMVTAVIVFFGISFTLLSNPSSVDSPEESDLSNQLDS